MVVLAAESGGPVPPLAACCPRLRGGRGLVVAARQSCGAHRVQYASSKTLIKSGEVGRQSQDGVGLRRAQAAYHCHASGEARSGLLIAGIALLGEDAEDPQGVVELDMRQLASSCIDQVGVARSPVLRCSVFA